ncbi:MAG: GNAT family N-acetyltransferase [Saprospiraceae bacterium]|nr:GNAT family N-acetyltransferase [Saprospiraceae bacterium]
MTIHSFEFATPQYDESVRLRDKLLRKPLGMEFETEELAKEYQCIHLGAFDDRGKMVGCLVLEPKEEGVYKMRQVAVEEPSQGKGIGKSLVLASEVVVKSLGAKNLILHARDTAIPFYEKLDYKKVGEEFYEVSILHIKMEKRF